MVAKKGEKRVGVHRRCRKKNVGELPHISVGPTGASRTAA